MSFLETLPLELTLAILLEWLGNHKAISCLDIACSAVTARAVLFDIIAHPSFLLRDHPRIGNVRAYFHWIERRRMRLAAWEVNPAHARRFEVPARALRSLLSLIIYKRPGAGSRRHLNSIISLLVHCEQLSELELQWEVDTSDLWALASMSPKPPIRSLRLSLSSDVSDSAMSAMVTTVQSTLQNISVKGGSVRPLLALAPLAGSLCSLSLDNCSLTAFEWHSLLGNMSSLSHLRLVNVGGMSDSLLASIAIALPALTELHCTGSPALTHRILSTILPSCRILVDLHVNRVISYSVRAGLAELVVYGNEIIDCVLMDMLVAVDTPLLLFSSWCSASAAEVRMVGHRGGAVLRRLVLSLAADVRDEDLAACLCVCPQLRQLVLYQCSQLTDEALATLARFCPQTSTLHLTAAPHFTDAGVEQVLRVTGDGLVSLSLHGCRSLTPVTLQNLATHCRSIRVLSLMDFNAEQLLRYIAHTDQFPRLLTLTVHHKDFAKMHKVVSRRWRSLIRSGHF